MATVLTEGRHPGDFLINEDEGNYSRDNVTLAGHPTLACPPGTVVGSDGTDWHPLGYFKDSTWDDGSTIPSVPTMVGIAYAGFPAAVATKGVVIVREAEVIADMLDCAGGTGPGSVPEATAFGMLATCGIVVRKRDGSAVAKVALTTFTD